MITRNEFVSGASTFQEYYAQFVNDATINHVVSRIGADRILKSSDPAMNDIPMKLWDRTTSGLPHAVSFKDVEDYSTLAGLVCIAKEAARQYVEKQK